jgi:hypothetical protein
VTVPPNLMQIDSDDSIKALVLYRIGLAARLNLLEKIAEESKVD